MSMRPENPFKEAKSPFCIEWHCRSSFEEGVTTTLNHVAAMLEQKAECIDFNDPHTPSWAIEDNVIAKLLRSAAKEGKE